MSKWGEPKAQNRLIILEAQACINSSFSHLEKLGVWFGLIEGSSSFAGAFKNWTCCFCKIFLYIDQSFLQLRPFQKSHLTFY